MQKISFIINKPVSHLPRSRREEYVNEACRFLYGSDCTPHEKKNLYYGIGTIDPSILPRLIREAREKSDYMWRERKIQTNARAHFWVLLRKARAEAPKKSKKLKQLSFL